MKFQVMDHSGHSTLEFDAAMADQVAAGEAKFKELMGQGYTAYERTGEGNGRIVRSFDPERTQTLFRPRLVGG